MHPERISPYDRSHHLTILTPSQHNHGKCDHHCCCAPPALRITSKPRRVMTCTWKISTCRARFGIYSAFFFLSLFSVHAACSTSHLQTPYSDASYLVAGAAPFVPCVTVWYTARATCRRRSIRAACVVRAVCSTCHLRTACPAAMSCMHQGTFVRLGGNDDYSFNINVNIQALVSPQAKSN